MIISFHIHLLDYLYFTGSTLYVTPLDARQKLSSPPTPPPKEKEFRKLNVLIIPDTVVICEMPSLRSRWKLSTWENKKRWKPVVTCKKKRYHSMLDIYVLRKASVLNINRYVSVHRIGWSPKQKANKLFFFLK